MRLISSFSDTKYEVGRRRNKRKSERDEPLSFTVNYLVQPMCALKCAPLYSFHGSRAASGNISQGCETF